MKALDYLKLHLPFQYIWLLKTSLGKGRTILDLGCGDGSLMQLIANKKDWQITGVDIYKKYLEIAEKKNIYHRLIQGDILQVLNSKELESKYDVVFVSQVIEHMSKTDGVKMLRQLERLAKKRIVVSSPRGFMEQPHEFLDENAYQLHKSGWDIEEFTKRGYRVVGVGFLPIWSHHGLGRNANLIKKIIANIISYLMSPVVYAVPIFGSGIIAVKDKEK